MIHVNEGFIKHLFTCREAEEIEDVRPVMEYYHQFTRNDDRKKRVITGQSKCCFVLLCTVLLSRSVFFIFAEDRCSVTTPTIKQRNFKVHLHDAKVNAELFFFLSSM